MTQGFKTIPVTIFLLQVATISFSAPDRTNPAHENGVPISIPFLEETPILDGVLTDPIWLQAQRFSLSYEVSPGENTTPPVETDVFVAHDRTQLFVGVRCHDMDPSAIRARFLDRDSAWNDDRIVIVLDTFNDEKRAYYFSSNPFGIQMDYAGPVGREDIAWDAIWDAVGLIDTQGWTLEMAIPFSAIRSRESKAGQTWGFTVSRFYPRDFNTWMAINPDDRNIDNLLSESIKVFGFKGIQSGKNLEITPSVVGLSTWTDAPVDESNQEDDFGITAEWGVTRNMTLLGTINPDFSHVEADALQLEVNQPFALSFAEKRQFFSQGADFFETKMRAVHTRTIRDPDWGAKCFGKWDQTALSAFAVQDQLTNLIFPGSQYSQTTSIPQHSEAQVGRITRDLGSDHRIGLLFTNRSADGYQNRVGGVDGTFRLSKRDRLEFQYLKSDTEYPQDISATFAQPSGIFSDHALDVFYTHNGRNLSLWGGHANLGEGFRADLGFIPQVGFRQNIAGAGYTWISPPGTWWSNIDLNGQHSKMDDIDGRLLRETSSVFLNFNGTRQSSFSAVQEWTSETFGGVQYDLGSLSLSGEFRPIGDLHLWAGCTFGDRIDYANNRLGYSRRFLGRTSIFIGNHVQFGVNATVEKMDAASRPLFTALIAQGAFSYHFNRKSFLRTIIQYSDQKYNVENYTVSQVPEFCRRFTQLLFSHKVNARTLLFLGYSSDDTDTKNSDAASQTLLLKLSYAWQH